jgi:hypothetical protein
VLAEGGGHQQPARAHAVDGCHVSDLGRDLACIGPDAGQAAIGGLTCGRSSVLQPSQHLVALAVGKAV